MTEVPAGLSEAVARDALRDLGRAPDRLTPCYRPVTLRQQAAHWPTGNEPYPKPETIRAGPEEDPPARP